MKKALFVFYLASLLFSCITPLPAHPVDITEEFYKTICKEPKDGLKILYRAPKLNFLGYYKVTINNNNNEQIGFIECIRQREKNKKEYIQRVSNILIDDPHKKNGYGSDLLKFALRQCKGNCLETVLTALPPSKKPEDFQALKRLYTRHGGLLNNKTMTEHSGEFAFKSSLE